MALEDPPHPMIEIETTVSILGRTTRTITLCKPASDQPTPEEVSDTLIALIKGHIRSLKEFLNQMEGK